MLWIVYNVSFSIGFTAMLPWFFWRMWRRGGYRRGFMQRLAVYDGPVRARLAARRRIWIHAVSVGEMYVALEFMKELRTRRTGTAFVVTTTTSTAHRIAERLLAPEDVLLYFPADFPPVVRKALDLFKPEAVILTESEFWPNLIRLCGKRRIPVVLINGRISDRSLPRYRMARIFFRRALGDMSLFCMQSAEDARRIAELGAARERIHTPGSAKYDVARFDASGAAAARDVLARAGFGVDDPIILGGSTWPGEEAAQLSVYRDIRARFPTARLVLVPRHEERSPKVLAEIRAAGLSCIRRRELDSESRAGNPPDVLLVDTTGELKSFYSCASLIFVGKSLTCHGGQNIIEPALFGKPVIVGPNMENFRAIMDDFREAGAIVEVASGAELAETAARLLGAPAARSSLGERARALVTAKRGAVARMVELSLALLSQPAP